MLHIITVGDYELIEQVVTDLLKSRSDINIIHIGKIHWTKIQKIKSYLLCLLRIPNSKDISSTIINKLSIISKNDSVLLWFSETMPEIFAISSVISATKKSVWLWNTMSNNILKSILLINLRKKINFYTFDEMDSKKYGIKYKDQVCYDLKKVLPINKTELKTDLYFCGVDKGRYKTLINLYKRLSSQGIKCDFNIVPDKHSKNITHEVKSEEIKLVENLSRINSTKCILEIMKKGQRGLTLRSLEAMIMGKKLITNNKHIMTMPFYSSQNILIIDNNTDITNITNFWESESYTKLQEGWYNKYMPYSWIKDFI